MKNEKEKVILEQLYLNSNNITEIKGLDNLINLKRLLIHNNGLFDDNPIKSLEDMRNSGIDVQYW